MFLTTLTPARAQSGTYGTPTYGGTCTGTSTGAFPQTDNLYLTNSSASLNAPLLNPGTLSVSGTCTATFAWPTTGSPGPAPQQVIVAQTCDISFNNQAEPPAGGTCGDGLGDSPVPGSGASGTPGWTYRSCSSGGTHYAAQAGGQAVTATCSPSLTLGGGTQGGGGGVLSYAAAIYPVTIQITGAPTTTTGATGGPPEALAGEQITASIAGLPLGCTVTSSTWSTSGGNPFATFNPALPSNQQVPLNPPTNGSPLTFYDIGNGDKVYVTCTAVIQPPTPSGGTAPPTLSLSLQSQPVTFIAPSFENWIIEHGYAQSQTGQMESGDVLQLAEAPLSGQASGEEWNGVSVTFPASLPQAYKSGSLGFAQLDDPTYTYSPAISDPEPNNGLWGLDTGFPIASFGFSTPSGNNSSYGPEEGDSPGTKAGTATTVTANEQFVTWLLYEPPSISTASGPTIWVPIASYPWGWGGTATLSNGTWALSGLSPASAGAGGPASASYSYPTWTLVHNG